MSTEDLNFSPNRGEAEERRKHKKKILAQTYQVNNSHLD